MVRGDGAAMVELLSRGLLPWAVRHGGGPVGSQGVAGLVMAVAAIVGRQPTGLCLAFALSCTGRGDRGDVAEFGKEGEKVLPQARGGAAAPWCAVEVLSPADG